MDLTNKAANAIICTTLNEFSNQQLVWPNYHPIRGKTTQRKLLEIITNIDGTPMSETDRQAAWDAFLKKQEECNPIFLEEMLFWLSELIFGTGMIGRNT